MTPEVRIPPHSTEAEQSLIGALLLDNEAWDKIGDLITAKDFYEGRHRKIYEVIEGIIATNPPADVVTVSQALEDQGVGQQCGGSAYLAALSQTTPTALNIRRYAEVIKAKALLRNMIRVCGELMEAAWNPTADPDAALEMAEQKIFELRQRRIVKTATTFPQILSRVFEQIDKRYHSPNKDITGISTGFTKLDEITAGMQRGDLIIVSGRPSMGKTALAMNISEHVGLVLNQPVAVFSIEMSDTALVQRMLGSVGRVDQHKLKTGRLSDDDWSRLSDAMSKLSAAPFIVEETSALTIGEMRARTRRIAKDNPGLALIVLDYLQLMATHGRSQSERTSEISDISRGLKALAKELDVPIMALSQLNRGVEARPNKRPMNSDLRDSGSIEQDADLIVHMYRDDYYTEDSPAKGYAEAIVGKQRNGDVGTVYLRFHRQETRFEDAGAWSPPKRERKKKGFVAEAEADAARRAEEEHAS